jgi:nucleotide-binding universal stress UspA family protein
MVPAEYCNRGSTWVKSAMAAARGRGHYQRVEAAQKAAQKAQEAGAELHILEVCFAPGDTGLTLEKQIDMEQDESVVVKSSEGHAWNAGVLVGSELLAIYNGSASTKDNGGISGWTKVSCMLLQ